MRAVGLAFIVLLAGCVAPQGTSPGTPDAVEPPVLRSALGLSAPLTWRGDISAGQSQEWSIAVAANGFDWENHAGGLVVSLRWSLFNDTEDVDLNLQVTDPDGRLVADEHRPIGRRGASGQSVTDFFGSSVVAKVPKPMPGNYAVIVRADSGSTSYEAAAHIQARPTGTQELLPNLVTLPPHHLNLQTPQTRSPPYSELGRCITPLDTPTLESPKKCLRFGLALGNVGEGAMELRLPAEQGAPALTGAGDAVQRVHRADGTFDDHVVGTAEFHASHGHFHYSGAVAATLYRYDLVNQTRGEATSSTSKTGLCPADLSLVHPGSHWTDDPAYDGEGCLDAARYDGHWVTGLAPGWYDLYPGNYPDQYLVVDGLPNGVYELVARANGDGSIRETTGDDNEASVVFRMVDEKVEVLFEVSHFPPVP